MSAKAVHLGRLSEQPAALHGPILEAAALAAALRALERRKALNIPEHAIWPTCDVMISLDEAAALLAAIPERRWPESTRALRRELQTLVREGERTRP